MNREILKQLNRIRDKIAAITILHDHDDELHRCAAIAGLLHWEVENLHDLLLEAERNVQTQENDHVSWKREASAAAI